MPYEIYEVVEAVISRMLMRVVFIEVIMKELKRLFFKYNRTTMFMLELQKVRLLVAKKGRESLTLYES